MGAHYRPRLNIGGQLEAFLCWRTEPAVRYILVEGGYGSGKTHCGTLMMIDALARNRCVDGLAAATTYGTVDEDLLPRLEEVAWQYGLRPKLHVSRRVLELRELRNPRSKWNRHSVIYCRSAARAESIEAISVGVILADERGRWRRYPTQPKRDGAKALKGRLRDRRARYPLHIDVGTPEGKATSTYEEYHEGPADEKKRRIWERTHRVFTMSTTTNRHNVTPGFIEGMEADYDDDLILMYRDGIPMDVGVGFAYAGYGEHNQGSVAYRPDMPLWLCFDFGTKMGCAIIVQPQGQPPKAGVQVIGEVIDRGGASTHKLMEQLGQLVEVRQHIGPVVLFGDATGKRSDTRGNTDDWRIVAQYVTQWFNDGQVSLKAPDANPAVRERVLRVRGVLKAADGSVRLTLDPRKTPTLHKDLASVQWKGDELDHGADGLLTHTSDALGYALAIAYPIERRHAPMIQTDGPSMTRIPVGRETPDGWKYGDMLRRVNS